MKKSFFLRMLLAFSLFAPTFMQQALAQPTPVQPSGSGTSGDPYQVSTLANLYWIMQDTSSWHSYFLQTENIDASSTSQWVLEAHEDFSYFGFPPIGNGTTPFTGTYDGDYHYISGLSFGHNGMDSVGLFGSTNGAQIKNLGVTVSIFAADVAGALIGSAVSTNVTNCYSTGLVGSGDDIIGGLVGRGGVSIIRCFSLCTVIGTAATGGMVGLGGTISNSYFNGAVNAGGNEQSAGLVGYLSGTLTNSYAVATGDYAYGLTSSGSSPNDCFWNSEIGSPYLTNSKGLPLTNTEMRDASTFTSNGWDFAGETGNGSNDIWDIDPHINNGFPFLAWQLHAGVPVSITNITTTLASIDSSQIGFTAESGTVSLSYIKHDDTPPDLPGGAVTIGNYWTVNSISGGNVKLRLYYPSSATSSFSGAPTIIHYSGAEWESLPTSSEGTDGSFNYVETTGYYSSFSPVTVGDGSAALPVELTQFTASAEQSNVELNWQTATEVNNYGFEVQRSGVGDQPACRSANEGGKSEVGGSGHKTQTSNQAWSQISFVQGSGTSNALKEYSFTDKVLKSGKYSYRLKQIDRDGKFSYSQEVEVTVEEAPRVFALEQNYPNPFNPSTAIRFTIQDAGLTTLKIYDAIGREVAVLVNDYREAGVLYQTQFDATMFASGIYFARLSSEGKSQIKKLMLMK